MVQIEIDSFRVILFVANRGSRTVVTGMNLIRSRQNSRTRIRWTRCFGPGFETIHQKPLLNADKGQKSKFFALFLNLCPIQ